MFTIFKSCFKQRFSRAVYLRITVSTKSRLISPAAPDHRTAILQTWCYIPFLYSCWIALRCFNCFNTDSNRCTASVVIAFGENTCEIMKLCHVLRRCPVMLVAGDDSPHLDETVELNGKLDPTNSSWMKVPFCFEAFIWNCELNWNLIFKR